MQRELARPCGSIPFSMSQPSPLAPAQTLNEARGRRRIGQPNSMQNTPHQRRTAAASRSTGLIALLLLIAIGLLAACGPNPTSSTQSQSPQQRAAAIVAIAQQYGATQDLEAARVALAALNVQDPAQAVLAQAEANIVQKQNTQTTAQLVALAKALGPLSRMAEEFLAAEGQSSGVPAAMALAPTHTPVPTPTPLPPTETPTPQPTATPTGTPEPTATATVVAQPQASTTSAINVRGGPGTVYPVIAQLQPGRPVDIIGRNADRTWWQVLLGNGDEGWVAASVVDVTGPLDAVAVAATIPAAPVQPTAQPQPTAAPAAPPTQPPAAQPSGGYALVGFRLRPVGSDSQRCDGGDHNIFVTVVDAGGAPINGVRVQEIFTGDVKVTGDQGKGPGRVEWDIYRGGGGVVQIVDGNNNAISTQTPGMSADWPPIDLMYDAGYCNCKPHPDKESCRADLESKNYFFAVGHYVYEVTFQRQ